MFNKKGRIPYDNAVLYYNGMEDIVEKTRYNDFNLKGKTNFDMQDFLKNGKEVYLWKKVY